MNLLFDNICREIPGTFEKGMQKFLLDNIQSMLPKQIAYKDLPNLAPPYQEMWFEWTMDDHALDINPYKVGAHVRAPKNTDQGWNYTFAIFWGTKKGVQVLPYIMEFSIPPDGRVERINYKYSVLHGAAALSAAADAEVDLVFGSYVGRIMFAIGLLHCKNIIEVEKGGKNPNVKNRRHRSKGTKHYVLNIVPARNIKRTEYEQSAKGNQQRLHFRRGHFKEYTTEKPLFGKYVGVFWWEAHAAGNAEIGEIKKDYRILPMQQGGQADLIPLHFK